jgi:hypothetical protein
MITIRYVAQNGKNEKVVFALENPMQSRSKAIKQMRIWKGENLTYKELKLKLEIYAGENMIQSLAVLTGNRMHSDEIVETLGKEYDIFEQLGFNFPFAIVEHKGKKIRHLIVHYIPLYYFTVI